MSKSIIIAAAISALVVATPALAQDRGKPAGTGSTGFDGRNGSATDLRDAPRRDTSDRIGREIRSSGVAEPRQPGRDADGAILRDIRSSGVVESHQPSEAPEHDADGAILRDIRSSGVVKPR